MGSTWEGLGALERRIAVDVLLHGPVSRAELARRFDLSPASLSRLTRPLTSRGIVREVEGEDPQGRGRPARPLAVDVGEHHFLGITVTPDALHGAVTDMRATLLDSFTVPVQFTGADVPGTTSLDAVVAAVAVAHGRATDLHGIDGVGISVGGKVESPGLVSSRRLGWERVDLAGALGAAGCRGASVGNDVDALARALRLFAVDDSVPRFALVTAGAGVGYALVVGDEVLAATDGIEHLRLSDHGPLCAAGHRGCAGAYLTDAMVAGQARAVGLEVGGFRDLEECAGYGFGDETEDGYGGDGSAPGAQGVAGAALGQRGGAAGQRGGTLGQGGGTTGQADRAARSILAESAGMLGRLLADVTRLGRVDVLILAAEAARLARCAPADIDRGLEEGHVDPASVTLLCRPSPANEWARGAAALAIESFVAGGGDAGVGVGGEGEL